MSLVHRQQVRRARRRMCANHLVRGLGLVLLVAAAAVGAGAIVQRLFPVAVVTTTFLLILLAAGLAGLGVLFWLGRPDELAAAILMDERLGLKTRLSTAVLLAGSDDPFAQATVRQAEDLARRLDPAAAVPVGMTGRWLGVPLAWALVGAAILWLPQMDVLGFFARQEQEHRHREQLQQARAEVQDASQAVQTAIQQIQDEDLSTQLSQLNELMTMLERPADVRREAVRRLEDLSSRLEQMRDPEQVMKQQETRSLMRRLRGVPDGLDRRLDDLLARGEFADAAQRLEQMRQDLAEGRLSAEQIEALTRQLNRISEQLGRVADIQQRRQDALRQAGVPGDLASLDKPSLAERLRELGYSPEEIESLLNRLDALASACQNVSELGERMGECGGGEGLTDEQLAELAQFLSQMDASEMHLRLTQAALDEIQRQMAGLGQRPGGGAGLGDGSETRSPTAGTGHGRAAGDRPEARDDGVDYEPVRAPTQTGPGGVIASWAFRGDQVPGEARRQAADAVQTARDAAAEAVSQNQIPRRYESAVRRYFGEMQPPQED